MSLQRLPVVAGGVGYYTRNDGQIGGLDAGRCGEVECFPLRSEVTFGDICPARAPVPWIRREVGQNGWPLTSTWSCSTSQRNDSCSVSSEEYRGT